MDVRNSTKQMINIMQAFADGKEIEWKGISEEDNMYSLLCCPDWNWKHYTYRIKPMPTYRPYQGLECNELIGKILVLKGNNIKRLVVGTGYGSVVISAYNGFNSNYNDGLTIFNDWTFEDGTPVGKLVN